MNNKKRIILAETSVEVPFFGNVHGYYVFENGKIHIEPTIVDLERIEKILGKEEERNE